jgi:HEAT repeat protein
MVNDLDIKESNLTSISQSVHKDAVDVFGQLIKTVKAKLVYPATSKLPQQFLETLLAILTPALENHEELDYKIEADGVLLQDQSVYSSKTKSDNFAHVFFKDGITQITFKDGVTLDELQKFVEIIFMVMRSAAVEDDLATLFWEADFKHITYQLMDDSIDIETFEYGTDTLRTEINKSGESFEDIFKNLNDLDLTKEDFDLESDKNNPNRRPRGYDNISDDVAQYISRLTVYDEEEKAALTESIESEKQFDYAQYVVDILYEILGLEKSTAGYNETIGVISKVRDDFLRSGNIKYAIAILERAKELETVFENMESPNVAKIKEFVISFSSSERTRIVVDMLNNSKDIDYSLIPTYFKMLSWEAIDSLVWALGELNHYPARKAICQALESISANHVEILGKGIDNPRWYVVRNIVSILGKIGKSHALSFFRQTIKHPDLRVRKETIYASSKIELEQANDFLIIALKDENESIRNLALKEIVKRQTVSAFPYLEKMILDKGFKNHSTEQAREIMEAYARLGGPKAFELLEKISKKFTLIPSSGADRMRINAVKALSYVPGVQTSRLLHKYSDSRNKTMADAATRGLAARKARRNNSV